MDHPLHIKVAPEIYERRGEWFGKPVTVSMTEPNADGEIEMLFTDHPSLWLVDARYRQALVRAHTAEEAIGRFMGDVHDVDGDIRANGDEMGYKPARVTATLVAPMGECGVIVDIA